MKHEFRYLPNHPTGGQTVGIPIARYKCLKCGFVTPYRERDMSQLKFLSSFGECKGYEDVKEDEEY